MFAFVLAAAATTCHTGPLVALADFPADRQWAFVAACPRIAGISITSESGTGVTVGVRDGFAYILTARHVVPEAGPRELHYFTPQSYPARSRVVRDGNVEIRLPTPDLALIRVPIGHDPVPVVKLAGPGQRPKSFPAAMLSIGCNDGGAPTVRGESIQAKRLVRRPDDRVAFFWETPTPPVPGRSGGPLIAPNGTVVGLCSASQDGRGYYTHLDEILAALRPAGYAWLWEGK
jgi:S1-C subfamily serine protease